MVSIWTSHDESWCTQNQLQECGLQRLNVVFDIDFLGFLLGTGANCFLRGSVCRFAQLDLNKEPLREWVAQTPEAARLDLSESPSAEDDDSIPEDIQID